MQYFKVLLLLIAYPSLIQSQILINEIQSSNKNTIFDEYGDREDWFELYNAGNAEVDLAGYVLKDNVDTWAIPSNDARTKIAAKGYLVFWADDEEETEGVLHTNFKLSASNGEFLGLFMPDSITVADSVHFPALNDDAVYARLNEKEWAVKTTPTPYQSNIKVLRVNNFEKPADRFIVNTSGGIVRINIPEALQEGNIFKIYNILGNELSLAKKQTHQIIIDSRHNKPGVYMLKYSGMNGSGTYKFAIN